MAKNKISDYSATPANNTDINNIDIAEGCSPSGINNAIRELMADLKDWQAGSETGQALAVASGGTGGETAAAARTNLSAAQSGANSDITSLSGLTTPITVAQGGTGFVAQRTITTVGRATNVVTIATSVAHNYVVNDIVTIAAVTNTSVNGTFTIASVPTSTTFTYAQTGTDYPNTTDTGTTTSSSYLVAGNISGVVAVNHGGTGTNVLKANNLALGNGTSPVLGIPAGSAGNVLTSSTLSTVAIASLVEGTEYTISATGTGANWTSIGAASSAVGTVFTKNSVAGTGTDATATTNTWVSSAPAQNGLGQGQTWQDMISVRNDTVVTAGSFVVGNIYTIVAVGTTNFTSIGASSNTVGVVFTATGVGSGTGTARNTYRNTTGKPIVVNVTSDQGSSFSATLTATIDGVSFTIATDSNSGGGNRSAGNVIVPNNSTYMIVASGSGVSGFDQWVELR
jgi:hypothetical protein